MTAPDYISPIVGYRVWQWDAGLKSLNGVQWHPRQVIASECRSQRCYEAPQAECTCGIYASKKLEHLRRLGFMENRVHGEVSLWGTVVEHQEGWRAQFAYPKSFTAPLSLVPLGMSRAEAWLAALSAFGCDIFINGDGGTVPLWHRESGVDASGIDLLVRRSGEWYALRAEQRRIKPGDRVVVIGHGIAIVEHADDCLVQAVLGNRSVLTVERETVVWCERYTRWEVAGGVSMGITACRLETLATCRGVK